MSKEWTVQTALEQLASCKYECEAGDLQHNVAFIWLEEHAVELDALIWKDLQ